MKNEAIRNLLEKAQDCAKDKRIAHYKEICERQAYKWIMQDMFALINEALALLALLADEPDECGSYDVADLYEAKPTCSECNDSGEVTKIGTPQDMYPRTSRYKAPCPKCQPQEPKPDAGEFVKQLRKNSSDVFHPIGTAIARNLSADFKKAAARIEQLQKEKGDIFVGARSKWRYLNKLNNKQAEQITSLQVETKCRDARIDQYRAENTKQAILIAELKAEIEQLEKEKAEASLRLDKILEDVTKANTKADRILSGITKLKAKKEVKDAK